MLNTIIKISKSPLLPNIITRKLNRDLFKRLFKAMRKDDTKAVELLKPCFHERIVKKLERSIENNNTEVFDKTCWLC